MSSPKFTVGSTDAAIQQIKVLSRGRHDVNFENTAKAELAGESYLTNGWHDSCGGAGCLCPDYAVVPGVSLISGEWKTDALT